jgi:CrcB protein
MKKYVLIGAGGFLGAVLRYYVKNTELFGYSGAFPLNTLLINVTGSFLLAFILTFLPSSPKFRSFELPLKLAVGTGFLGAFTTFSTMCREAAVLINGRYFLTALSYISIAAFIGLCSAYIGYIAAEKLTVGSGGVKNSESIKAFIKKGRK